MENEIVNKVANSSLEVFDLEDFYPTEELVVFDISQFLFEGFLLKEKEFRADLKAYNWEQFNNKYVAIFCSTDAILPAWAFMLVSTYLQNHAKKAVQGTLNQLKIAIYQDIIDQIDFSFYQDKPVIIKGCSKKPIPEEAYVMAIQPMMQVARSIMFGEACSAVPMYKRK
ncbi:DUF2480 family protein [Flavobacterium agricola]|uniref:DUF2480 family protein n=1 Tax=Flavobacterium agricola TaxID=2870839 RepID=A0ABY6LZQ6_9FLAO|nr:DUF2480 family protein [Flavobacterium agricola]UYW01047.1 DUF2480 family protein [Flavobacterium agricola]